MDKDNKQEKQQAKPDENLQGSAAAHLVIRDKKSGAIVFDGRG